MFFFSKQLSFKINIIQQIKIIFDVKMYTIILLRIKSFSKTFFPYCIDQWSKLLIRKLEMQNLYLNKKNNYISKTRKFFI